MGGGVCILPSSLDHLFPIRSSAYVSPVIMYFPVSPVAPPYRITFDFDTKKAKIKVSLCHNKKRERN